jgi:hypothetical protein
MKVRKDISRKTGHPAHAKMATPNHAVWRRLLIVSRPGIPGPYGWCLTEPDGYVIREGSGVENWSVLTRELIDLCSLAHGLEYLSGHRGKTKGVVIYTMSEYLIATISGKKTPKQKDHGYHNLACLNYLLQLERPWAIRFMPAKHLEYPLELAERAMVDAIKKADAIRSLPIN